MQKHLFEYLIGGKKKPRASKTFINLDKGDDVWRWRWEHGKLDYVEHYIVLNKGHWGASNNWTVPMENDKGQQFSPGIEPVVAEEKDICIWDYAGATFCYMTFGDEKAVRDELKKLGKL